MEVKGKIEKLFATQKISETFKKREFVLEYVENPKYPEYLKLEFIQDKCDLLDSFSEGQEVNVSINLKGRKWTDPQGNDKYFNTLQAWKIEAAGQSQAQNTQGNGDTPPPPENEPDWLNSNDDLPF